MQNSYITSNTNSCFLITLGIDVYATDGWGVGFTQERIEYLPDEVDIEDSFYYSLISPSLSVISDSLVENMAEWQVVENCFVADSAYEYMILGNFLPNDQLKTKRILPRELKDPVSYNLFDDIYLGEVPSVPLPDLGADTTLCQGESLVLSAHALAGTTYYWQDSSRAPTFEVTESGTYWLEVTNGYCFFRDSIEVTFLPPVTLPADTLLCEGEQLELIARPFRPDYQWSTGATGSSILVSSPGYYEATLSGGSCLQSANIRVEYQDCPSFVPNVFTPNQDGRNDTFWIEGIGNREWSLTVYNRWGEHVFYAFPYQNDWQAAGLTSGVYYYLLSNKALQTHLKGIVQVVR